VHAAWDQVGLLELAAGDQRWRVVDRGKLHRLVVDDEPQPSPEHLCALVDAKALGHLGRRRDGRNVQDLLARRVALLAHLGVEAGLPLLLVAVVVLGRQGDGDR
jgi:hypothetical protein